MKGPTDLAYCSREVAQKVAYEFYMFDFVGNWLDSWCNADGVVPGTYVIAGTGDSSMDDQEAWAMLESFLVHTRILYEFFTLRRRWYDNIMPSDFVDPWDPVDPSEFTYLTQDRLKRIQKSVAHLAKERTAYEPDKDWNITLIREELGEVISRFLNRLPDERREWFTYTF